MPKLPFQLALLGIDKAAGSGALLSMSLIFASLSAMGLAVVLGALVFAILSRRISRLTAQVQLGQKRSEHLAAELEAQALLFRQMSLDLEELRQRGRQGAALGSHEFAPPVEARWTSAGNPINLNRKGQILRLAKKGKSVGEIAHDLQIAQGEVELLLKVHDLSHSAPEI